jgi:anti-sigma regulatory factor (Ser/Thr protein kinase)
VHHAGRRPLIRDRAHAFAHDALLYDGPDDFLEGTLPFLREGLAAGEAMLVAVPQDRIALLRAALTGHADRVCLVDMTRLGRNPAAIISAWRDFLGEIDVRQRPARGIGEPIWDGRSAQEIVECQRHESLLNLAFDDGPPWQLMCPYDTRALPDDVILEARRSHPFVRERGVRRESRDYVAPASVLGPEEDDLPVVPDRAQRLAFTRAEMTDVRRLVSRQALQAGLDEERRADLVLAVSEVASNSVLHGGGDGVLAIWRDADALVCEVRDRGRIADPLVGRARPSPHQRGGHGMWLVNALCDLVQVRALADGNVVRMTLHAR